MTEAPAYAVLADAFVAEGVSTVFALMGDGNMHWVTHLAERHGVRVIHSRHEHCACAAAIAYANATGSVGVASVTHGPGLTQTMTALATAAHSRIPLVVFAGETSLGARWSNQFIEQAPLVTAAGAHYVEIHGLDRLKDRVCEAFYVALGERRPVVIGVPYDLQKRTLASEPFYVPARQLLPPPQRVLPDPEAVRRVVEAVGRAKRPIVVAGRGALDSGARDEIESLAERCGALLATTLPVKGFFEGNPFDIGIMGGFGSDLLRGKVEECDLLVAVGASLSYFTLDGGGLVAGKTLVQIDREPRGLNQGLRTASIGLVGDARASVAAILEGLGQGPSSIGFRSEACRREIAGFRFQEDDPSPLELGTFHPAEAIRALDAVIPKDWAIVSGGGHSAYFTALMRGRPAETFHTIRNFGAIGNGLAFAIGVAAAKGDKVVLIDGDGSLLMHIQELEVLRRQGIRILICALNDGAYGAEVHKLKFDGMDPGASIFGREDFSRLARGFGLGGRTITRLEDFKDFFSAFEAVSSSEVWDIPISLTVVSPHLRRSHSK